MIGVVRRGVRNLFRNRVRSLLVLALLAVMVASFVAFVAVASATGDEATRLRVEMATLLQVGPVGAPPGGGGGDQSLDEGLARRLEASSVISEVSPLLRRQFQDNDKPAQMGVVTGIRPGDTPRLASMGGFSDSPEIVEGRPLTPGDAGRPVAVVGQVLAEQYGVGVGDRLLLSAELLRGRTDDPVIGDLDVEVVGVYRTGVVFGDNQVFVPLDVLQQTLGREGEISGMWVRAASADLVSAAEEAVREVFGTGVDVLVDPAAARLAAESAGELSRRARFGAVLVALASAGVVALTMALVVRQRRAEIGLLRTLGAGHAQVVGQFAVEAMALALAGGILGGLVSLASTDPLRQVVAGKALGASGADIGWAVFAWALVAASVAGVLGSLYPTAVALRLHPAEALRPE